MRAIQQFTIPVTSGVTLTSSIDLGSESYDKFCFYVPSFTSGTDFMFQVSADDSTFVRLKYPIASGLVAPIDVKVGSATTQAWVPIPEINHRYVKVELSTAATATSTSFKVVIS
jgi:hypothetical protein